MAFFRKPLPASPLCGVVIVAAGTASRMQGINKIHALLCDMPVIVHTLLAFETCPLVDEIVLVCREEEMGRMLQYTTVYRLDKVRRLIAGGKTRQQSVFKGIDALSPDLSFYLIHDGARPCIRREVIEDVIFAAQEYGAASAAVKAKDTIKIASPDGFICSTPDRETLYCVQTPQVFAAGLYRQAMALALQQQAEYTDDCQLVEKTGHPVFLSPGDYSNLKITTPEDLYFAQCILENQEEGGVFSSWEE